MTDFKLTTTLEHRLGYPLTKEKHANLVRSSLVIHTSGNTNYNSCKICPICEESYKLIKFVIDYKKISNLCKMCYELLHYNHKFEHTRKCTKCKKVKLYKPDSIYSDFNRSVEISNSRCKECSKECKKQVCPMNKLVEDQLIENIIIVKETTLIEDSKLKGTYVFDDNYDCKIIYPNGVKFIFKRSRLDDVNISLKSMTNDMISDIDQQDMYILLQASSLLSLKSSTAIELLVQVNGFGSIKKVCNKYNIFQDSYILL